ncbi:alpha/beta hydrolase [Micromonospora sp. PLK6-60]|uniref:alpha/beta fold hydrolase n=1 Tax=Micromonospora sp. PLK6-60 TaxID=2873383 RepID=UPI001CA6BEA3|nr:alpha/beta hydrolase [Micromonospora sp. PLK6-60]MBY8871146.1 alpha/beta hydrolase [Micromonospora sp. PLK6-60]
MPRPALLALAAVAPLGWGLVVGWWTPRGPGTGGEAVTSIVVSVAVGLFAGWAARSRWAMLAAPVLFALAVELIRLPLRGPTVDAPHASPFGVAALLFGRGLHGLFTLLPLLIGAAYGAGLARLLRPASAAGPASGADRDLALARGPRPRRAVWTWLGRVGVGLLAALVLLVGAAAAQPARTPPIPGGVAELTSVRNGDRELGLLLRGQRPDAPVLLFVPGAPGSSEIGSVRRHLAGLERRFVVATLDRRGASKSWAAFPPSSTFTLDSEVDDALAVTDYLRTRFRQDRIYLMGHSGGSLVGVTAVQRRPELFRAYVGVGQAVDLREADRSQYADTVAWARRTGRDELARELTARGAPPYRDMYSYEPLLANETGAFDFDRTDHSEGRGGQGENLNVPEYALLEKVHVLSGTFDGIDVLYPTEQGVDLRRQVPSLDVPVWLVDGEREVPGRLALLQQWYADLQAPRKERVVLAGAGHRSLYQRPDEFVAVLDRVLAATTAPGT